MNRSKLIILIAAVLLALLCAVHADPVKLRLPGDAVSLINALAALDGVDRVIEAEGQPTRVVRVPYDFGKDSVRVRLAIRADLLALRAAVEAFEQSRIGYVKEVFGVESLTKEELAAQPEAKRTAFAAKVTPLFEPTKIELTLFTEADVTTFAAAGVPGTVSMALDPLVAKPAKAAQH